MGRVSVGGPEEKKGKRKRPKKNRPTHIEEGIKRKEAARPESSDIVQPLWQKPHYIYNKV